MQLSQHHCRKLGTSLVVIALLAVSCDSGDDTTLPETTTTAAPTSEEEVLTSYLAYWTAVDDVFDPPVVTPDLPALPMHATGEVLQGVITNAERTKERNEVFRVPEDGLNSHRATVLSVEGSTATVRDCNVDDTVVLDAVSGDVLDDAVRHEALHRHAGGQRGAVEGGLLDQGIRS